MSGYPDMTCIIGGLLGYTNIIFIRPCIYLHRIWKKRKLLDLDFGVWRRLDWVEMKMAWFGSD